jgi:hypothetical protein
MGSSTLDRTAKASPFRGWERRVNQDEKKQPGLGVIDAVGGLGDR